MPEMTLILSRRPWRWQWMGVCPAGAQVKMGEVFRIAPVTSSTWYRKSISLSKELTPRSEAERFLVFREEWLAEELVRKTQAAERVQLLEEANAQRDEQASTDPDFSATPFVQDASVLQAH